MTRRSRLRLPREHGAWAMLYVPLAVGALVAWSATIRLILLTLSVTFVFIARESLLIWWRGRSRSRQNDGALRFAVSYLAIAGVFGAPLLLIFHLYWFVPMGLAAVVLLTINAQQAVRGEDRTIGSQMIAIGGLTLTAPAAYYAARGAFDVTALGLWVVCTGYFASSVLYLKLRVSSISSRLRETRNQLWWRCALYHGGMLVSLLVLAMTRRVNLFALAAFAPVLIRSFWYLTRPTRKINFRRIGWTEVAYSLLFLVFTTLTFRV